MLTQKEFKTQVERIIRERYPLYTIEEKIKNNLESFSIDNKTINYLINYFTNCVIV